MSDTFRPYVELPEHAKADLAAAANAAGFRTTGEYLRVRILAAVAEDLDADVADVAAPGEVDA